MAMGDGDSGGFGGEDKNDALAQMRIWCMHLVFK